ncbi:hypothetical protein NB311A_01180 [Nitrobacter sp. Nb-311A]|nr:hypothetical protein NB311A_01180 [Nitrobacter sp. Nb-311A]
MRVRFSCDAEITKREIEIFARGVILLVWIMFH